jgi:hypothetical protein
MSNIKPNNPVEGSTWLNTSDESFYKFTNGEWLKQETL